MPEAQQVEQSRPRPKLKPEPDEKPKKKRGPAPGQICKQSGSEVDRLTIEASDLLLELKRLERPKLTGKAFLREAIAIANTTPERLADLDKLLVFGNPSVAELSSFVRIITKHYASPNFPQPHPEPLRLNRCFGSDGVPGEANELGFSIGEACAVAAMRASQDPDRFGRFESVEELKSAPVKVRQKLEAIYEKMRTVCTLEDLKIDTTTATTDERDRGLCRVAFKRASHVNLSVPDWPRLLAEHALATSLNGKQEAA